MNEIIFSNLTSQRPFKPNNQDEEVLLCLVLSQYLASKEVMLLRQPQFKQIREQTLANAISSLDLMLFYLGYHRSYNVLSDVKTKNKERILRKYLT